MSARIKLVACDVDGTLVDSGKRLPPGFPEAVRKLRARGVRFVIASGRQYYNVLKTFDVVKDDIDILSDNGAMLLDRDGAYFTSPLAADDVSAVCAAVASLPTVSVLLAGVRAAYMRAATPFCTGEVVRYYERLVIAPDAFRLAKEDVVCKIALFDDESSAKNLVPALAPFADHLTPSLSGDHWLDIMNLGIDKGSGLRILLDRFGVKPEECMAFGDYDNDIEMLRACGESYAMANATDAVKSVCRHEAPSNDEAGVMQVLYREFPFLKD